MYEAGSPWVRQSAMTHYVAVSKGRTLMHLLHYIEIGVHLLRNKLA